MSKLEIHSNGSHSVTTESGRKNIHFEVYDYIKGLERQSERWQEDVDYMVPLNESLEAEVKELRELLQEMDNLEGQELFDDWDERRRNLLTKNK